LENPWIAQRSAVSQIYHLKNPFRISDDATRPPQGGALEEEGIVRTFLATP
jgi:hypothetical protein